MAIGFPAHHTESYVPRSTSHELRFAVRRTFAALSWDMLDEGPSWMTATVNMNLRSNGETVFVEFMSDGSMNVTSKCTTVWWLFAVQIFDWGKNETNVRDFLAHLQKFD